ncbi:uncharacterized protein [Watersipora subatra]|uniref:uncharacterized protein n=1 Tax=Watersipora subatra TaxID=2589382 RepID=UPI00355B51B3
MASSTLSILLSLVAIHGILVLSANISTTSVIPDSNISEVVNTTTSLDSNATTYENATVPITSGDFSNSTSNSSTPEMTTLSSPTTSDVLPMNTTTASSSHLTQPTLPTTQLASTPAPTSNTSLASTPAPTSNTSSTVESSPTPRLLSTSKATTEKSAKTTLSPGHKNPKDQGDDSTGVVTGTIIGVIFAVIIIALAILFVVRRNRLMRRREGYGMFTNTGNDDDGDWTFNNPSYGSSGASNRSKHL